MLAQHCHVCWVGFNRIGPEQAGFRSGISTNDDIFALKMLIYIFFHTKKRLYVCFVDNARAFDSVNRVLLWQKLLACQMLNV